MNLSFASSISSIAGYNASKYYFYQLNMNNLIEVCEDFPYLNHFICATKRSLVFRVDFPFSILNLNKLIKYFIDANITGSQARNMQPLTHATSSRTRPPGWTSASSAGLPEKPSLEEDVNFSDRASGGCPSTLARPSF